MKNKVRPFKITIFRSISEMISFLDNFVTVKFKDGDRKLSNFSAVSPGTELRQHLNSLRVELESWKPYQKWRDKSRNKIMEWGTAIVQQAKT